MLAARMRQEAATSSVPVIKIQTAVRRHLAQSRRRRLVAERQVEWELSTTTEETMRFCAERVRLRWATRSWGNIPRPHAKLSSRNDMRMDSLVNLEGVFSNKALIWLRGLQAGKSCLSKGGSYNHTNFVCMQ